MLYEKNIRYIIFINILCFSIICASCISTKTNTEPTILEYQRRISELENTNKELTRRIDSATNRLSSITGNLSGITDELGEFSNRSTERIEDIRGRASKISDSIDRVIYLFGEYESEVDRLLKEIGNLQIQIKNINEDSSDTGDN